MTCRRLVLAVLASSALLAVAAVPAGASVAVPANTPGLLSIGQPRSDAGLLTLRVTSSGIVITSATFFTDFSLNTGNGELVAQNSGNHSGLCVYADHAAGNIYDMKTCDASKTADVWLFTNPDGTSPMWSNAKTQWDQQQGNVMQSEGDGAESMSVPIVTGRYSQEWHWTAQGPLIPSPAASQDLTP